MKFRTEIPPISFAEKISLKDKILTIGSCFSNNIGDKLVSSKLDCLVNPFGTIYDPLSISRLLRMSLLDTAPNEEMMVQSDGVWKNLMLHSSFSGLGIDELSLKIRAKTSQVKQQLESAKWLIITFGTAFAYKYKETNAFVTNCQKLPASQFSKELLDVKELKSDFIDFHEMLIEFNPDIRVVLTVSPVRHVRDGLVENSTSKSILRVLANELSIELDNTFYYPSYEIIMDDLRDYRYYKEDLIHPTEQATKYIWDHFCESFIDEEALEFIKKWEKIQFSLNHRPFNPSSVEHQQFLKKILFELESLNGSVNLRKEIDFVKDQVLDDQ